MGIEPYHCPTRSLHTRSQLSLQASGLPKAAEAVQSAPATSSSASSTTNSYPDGGPATPGVTTDAKSRSVYITWASGITSKFHNIWLRDHCRCPQCYHPTTKQRLLNTFEIAPDSQPISAEATTEGLLIHWPLLPSERTATASSSPSSSTAAAASDVSHDSAGAGVVPRHPSLYPWRWLMRNSYSPVLSDPITASSDDSGLKAIEKVLWGKGIGSAPPTVKYDEVMQSEEGVLKWVTKIVSCRSQGTQFYLASQSDVQRTELLTVSSRSKSSRTTGAVWLCLRIRRPANTNRHGGPHPPHRIHPRNSLRRLLGLYIGSSPRRHRLHGSCAASPYRHHLLQRPCRPADVPPAQPHGEQDGSR